MEEQQYMSRHQKTFVVFTAIFLCAIYAFYSRALDSKDLELKQSINESEFGEYIRNYERLQKYETPVVKEIAQLENGELLLVIGEKEKENVERQEAQLYASIIKAVDTKLKK